MKKEKIMFNESYLFSWGHVLPSCPPIARETMKMLEPGNFKFGWYFLVSRLCVSPIYPWSFPMIIECFCTVKKLSLSPAFSLFKSFCSSESMGIALGVASVLQPQAPSDLSIPNSPRLRLVHVITLCQMSQS